MLCRPFGRLDLSLACLVLPGEMGRTGAMAKRLQGLKSPVRDRASSQCRSLRERRGRDSNPRRLAPRWFSRPEPSTTRPPLLDRDRNHDSIIARLLRLSRRLSVDMSPFLAEEWFLSIRSRMLDGHHG